MEKNLKHRLHCCNISSLRCSSHTVPESTTRHGHVLSFQQLYPQHGAVYTHPFADRRSLVGLVGPLLLGQLAAGFQSPVINGLKDVLVEALGLGALERVPHQDEGVGQALHADANGTVAPVGAFGLRDIGAKRTTTSLRTTRNKQGWKGVTEEFSSLPLPKL